MPTSFIAVQCFGCSTMQVKQQKKSSNKWICVVCNEKQSVRKVFAQSFMAKDVRKVVQSFNMSRQLADQKQSLSNDEPDTTDSPYIGEPKRKRNDWSEYIDEQEQYCRKFQTERNCAQGDDAVEPVIVTEMPQAVFMKPKVKNYSSSSRSSEEKLCLKPSFPNRRNSKRHQNAHSLDTPCSERAEDNRSQESKWNSLISQIRDNCKPSATRSQPAQPINSGDHRNSGHKVSKWSSFITEDESDNDDDTIHRSFVSRERRDDQQFHLSMNDQIVEEDIHPDFL